MIGEKQPAGLTELIHLETKDFKNNFTQHYTPEFQKYQQKIYDSLIECYQTHITPETITTLNSDAMLKYYSCYKGILKKTREQNSKLYQDGLYIQKKLKQCLEIKSDRSKSKTQFEEYRSDCLEAYRNRYDALYKQVFLGIPRAKEQTQQ